MIEESTTPSAEFVAFQRAVAGRYSIERELGRGGMGIVFLAREVALDRMVALKLLPPELATRPEVKERFLREARTAARLSHPNIVAIHTVDEVSGFVFFAMAHVEGETLGKSISDRGPLSNSDARRLLREVSWALGHAHLHGVVHRDVKPDNILIERDSGRAMVADFGIAAMAGPTDSGHGEIIGTAEFMSPEQAKGDADAQSDLYSLGCVGFYALSGRVPFTGSTPAAILAQHVGQPAPPLLSVAPQVQAGLAAVVDRCLRKEPERRFSSASALAEALGPEGQLDRELPVPLRVFIKQNREWESVVAWSFLGLLFVVPLLVAAVLSGGNRAILVLGTIAAVLLGIPLGKLLRDIRGLLRSGFTRDDVTSALAQDIRLRDEEFRFQVGARRTILDRVLRPLKLAGYAGVAVSLPIALFGGGSAIADMAQTVFSWAFVTGLGASIVDEVRGRMRSDVIGERWLRVWRGWSGKALFRLAGLRLKRVAAAISGVHRPTEVALGLAADRLFEELPKETRRSLRSLPETVNTLEDDARTLRAQIAELDAVLAEIGDDDPARAGAEERMRVRAGVEATRDEAREQLKRVVKSLETIRLGLLLMHGGGGTVESMTLDLEAARDVAAEMEGLLEGRQEVERLLAGRRETGSQS